MWLIVVGIVFVSGILYYIFAGSMPRIILGITIGCGVVLLFYIVRFMRGKLRGRESDRIGDRIIDRVVDNMSDGEVTKHLSERYLRRDHGYKPIFPKSKVVSTEKVICERIEGEVHAALLLVHEDESITVKCSGDCSDCEYGDVE